METVVAMGLLALLGIGALHGLQVSAKAASVHTVRSTAENILRNQLEYVFQQPYLPPPGTYLTIATPPKYSVTAEALVYNPDSTAIETVRVTVSYSGRVVKTLETLRFNR